MNPHAHYLVIGEALPARTWTVHLHFVQGETVKEAALCGRAWLNKGHTRNFGDRTTFEGPNLAPGVEVCRVCEQLRNDETPEFLFGVAIEELRQAEDGHIAWVIQPVEHIHAKDHEDARVKALQIYSERTIRIIDVGRVIGYFVEDTKGDVLRA